MSAVDLATAEKVRAGNGVFPGDEHLPPIVRIIRYTNAWGGDGYKLVRKGQRDPEPSNFIRNPVVWWELPAKGGKP